MTVLERVADTLVARARAEQPGVDYSFIMTDALTLLLPKHSDRLRRPDDDGAMGYYSCHVYRDCEVTGINGLPAETITLVPVRDARSPRR